MNSVYWYHPRNVENHGDQDYRQFQNNFNEMSSRGRQRQKFPTERELHVERNLTREEAEEFENLPLWSTDKESLPSGPPTDRGSLPSWPTEKEHDSRQRNLMHQDSKQFESRPLWPSFGRPVKEESLSSRPTEKEHDRIQRIFMHVKAEQFESRPSWPPVSRPVKEFDIIRNNPSDMFSRTAKSTEMKTGYQTDGFTDCRIAPERNQDFQHDDLRSTLNVLRRTERNSNKPNGFRNGFQSNRARSGSTERREIEKYRGVANNDTDFRCVPLGRDVPMNKTTLNYISLEQNTHATKSVWGAAAQSWSGAGAVHQIERYEKYQRKPAITAERSSKADRFCAGDQRESRQEVKERPKEASIKLRAGKTKTEPIRELDEVILARREKQIKYGYETIEYAEYLRKVPKLTRTKHHPRTPDRNITYSRRNWDSLIKIWRKTLHAWDPEVNTNTSNKNTPDSDNSLDTNECDASIDGMSSTADDVIISTGDVTPTGIDDVTLPNDDDVTNSINNHVMIDDKSSILNNHSDSSHNFDLVEPKLESDQVLTDLNENACFDNIWSTPFFVYQSMNPKSENETSVKDENCVSNVIDCDVIVPANKVEEVAEKSLEASIVEEVKIKQEPDLLSCEDVSIQEEFNGSARNVKKEDGIVVKLERI